MLLSLYSQLLFSPLYRSVQEIDSSACSFEQASASAHNDTLGILGILQAEVYIVNNIYFTLCYNKLVLQNRKMIAFIVEKIVG